jgi:hypothetical protein
MPWRARFKRRTFQTLRTAAMHPRSQRPSSQSPGRGAQAEFIAVLRRLDRRTFFQNEPTDLPPWSSGRPQTTNASAIGAF